MKQRDDMLIADLLEVIKKKTGYKNKELLGFLLLLVDAFKDQIAWKE